MMKIFGNNKQVKFNFTILETFVAGIVLNGGEVKSIRANRISLKESFIRVKNGEAWLVQAHVSRPEYLDAFTKFDETQDRKLLLTKKEIKFLQEEVSQAGLTVMPTMIYQPEDSGKIKLEIVLCKGKQLHDKRESLKEADIKRETDRAMKERR